MPTRSTATTDVLPQNYDTLLAGMCRRIESARAHAAFAINTELILLYWDLGRDMVEQQRLQGWGSKVAARLANDLRSAFPDMRGLSRRNMQYMRAFAEAYPDRLLIESTFARIPWRHNMVLLDKLNTLAERNWYAKQALEFRWTRDVLSHHIKTALYSRQGAATTSFERTLPKSLSELAQQITRDPLVFELPGWANDVGEHKMAQALVKRVRDLLLSMGAHLAFVGNQYHIEFDEQHYYLDLVFYHTKLHAYVIVELKQDEFKPEYLGKLNFYLEVADEVLRDKNADAPSIGLLICRSKRKLTAELALRTTNKPVAVSSYELAVRKALTEKIQKHLPMVGERKALPKAAHANRS